MKKILLIEDDPGLSTIIKNVLSKDYKVTYCSTLEETYQAVDTTIFDVALIDRMLPDGDALEIIKHLNQTNFQTKIIAISQLYQSVEKIKGLESGADDYLPKPFSLAELKLKVKKTLQYEKRRQSDYFSTGQLQFFPDSGEIRMGAVTGKLRKKESDILACLFRYKNRVVSRNLLVDEVWANHDSIPTQTTLDVYIRRIRILLKEYGSLIITKRGFGYMLVSA